MLKFVSMIQVKTSVNLNKFTSNLSFLFTLKTSGNHSFVIISGSIQRARKYFMAVKIETISWKFYAKYQINVFPIRFFYEIPGSMALMNSALSVNFSVRL